MRPLSFRAGYYLDVERCWKSRTALIAILERKSKHYDWLSLFLKRGQSTFEIAGYCHVTMYLMPDDIALITIVNLMILAPRPLTSSSLAHIRFLWNVGSDHKSRYVQ
jgi:hypothetical protein